MNLQSTTRRVDEDSAGDGRGWLLCRGIKSLLRCDEAEVVEGIARYVMSQHGSLRIGSALMERARGTPLPAAAALLGGLTRFLEVRAGERKDGAVWIARLGNERRAVESLPTSLPELGWVEWQFRRRPAAAALAALAATLRGAPSARRVFRIARMLHRRHEFFKVLRVVELVGYYARYLGLFRGGRYHLALMSSHSNPHGIAFNLAARKCGVPVVLVTHGMPVRPVARLGYELAVVHCEAARRTYLEAGCRIGRVLIHGRRQDYAPMPSGPLPERLSVGVFLCKDVNEGRLRTLIGRLLADVRVARVLVRPHPKNLWVGLDAWIESRNEPRLRRSPAGPVSQDLEEADIVLAGNSSVLVEAVTAGRPAGYVSGIDHGPTDLHEFVARGLIYPIEDSLDFDPDAMLRFYRQPDWPTVLRLFANMDEDEAAVAAQAREVMRGLADIQVFG
ncbi:MAG TPA: hypothetical protein VE360_10550 [Pyrinomonadaceae bacterium]|nr:hypothetical protein [Pyrinomonadaceae bacterium]